MSFNFEENKTTTILGHSGCGKSTLLKLISGILDPNEGSITVENTSERLGKIAYMQQRDLLFNWLTVKENAILPLRIKGTYKDLSDSEVLHKAKILGIENILDYYRMQLSVGMKQRVAFLRTILQDSDFILLDEPFASLDAIRRLELYNWIENIKEKINKSFILVTHDIEEAIYLSDIVIIMLPGSNNFIHVKKITIPHPRKNSIITSQKFVKYKKQLLEDLQNVKNY